MSNLESSIKDIKSLISENEIMVEESLTKLSLPRASNLPGRQITPSNGPPAKLVHRPDVNSPLPAQATAGRLTNVSSVQY